MACPSSLVDSSVLSFHLLSGITWWLLSTTCDNWAQALASPSAHHPPTLGSGAQAVCSASPPCGCLPLSSLPAEKGDNALASTAILPLGQVGGADA